MTKLSNLYKKHQEVIDYAVFGILTTAVNFFIFYFLETVLSTSYLVANFFAIIISIFFAYLTNKNIVFKSKTSTWKQTISEFIHFVGLRLVSGLFDMGSMYFLIDGIGLNTNLSKILTQFVVVVSNYIFSKLFIFKNKD